MLHQHQKYEYDRQKQLMQYMAVLNLYMKVLLPEYVLLNDELAQQAYAGHNQTL